MADIPKPTINVDGNKIYDDAIAPVTHPTAQTLGLIPRAIKAALFPIEKWIIQKEHALKETERLLEKKLQNTVPEKIVTPEAYIAVPAMQAISYSMDNERDQRHVCIFIIQSHEQRYKSKCSSSFC